MQLVNINSIKKIKKTDASKFNWICFSRNFDTKEKCQSILPNEKRIDTAQIFQDVCLKKRNEYLDIIGALGKNNDNELWWMSNISYNSPLTSDLFWKYCCIYSLKRIVKNNNNLLIISDDEDLLDCIRINFNLSKKQNISDRINFFLKKRIYKCQIHLYFVFFIFKAISLYIFDIFKRKTKKISIDYNNRFYKAKIIRITWVEKRSFKNGQFKDVYLNDLENYQSTPEKILTLTLPLINKGLLNNIYDSNEILPLIGFLDSKILIKSILKAYRFKVNLVNNHNNEINIDNLIENEVPKNRYLLFHPILFNELFTKFLRKTTLLEKIVFPFENQPYDKAIVIAKNNIHPHIKIIAHQHTSIPVNLLNYFISPLISKIIPTPDIIIATNNYNKQLLSDTGWRCLIENGGNLRVSFPKKVSAPIDSFKVLVVLSYDLNCSLSFLEYLKTFADIRYQYLIKPHPDFPEKVIRKFIPIFPDNFEFTTKNISESFHIVNKAFLNGTSSSIECLSAGLTVYKFIDDNIDLDPLLNTNLVQIPLYSGKKMNLDQTISFQDGILNFLEPPRPEIWGKYI